MKYSKSRNAAFQPRSSVLVTLSCALAIVPACGDSGDEADDIFGAGSGRSGTGGAASKGGSNSAGSGASSSTSGGKAGLPATGGKSASGGTAGTPEPGGRGGESEGGDDSFGPGGDAGLGGGAGPGGSAGEGSGTGGTGGTGGKVGGTGGAGGKVGGTGGKASGGEAGMPGGECSGETGEATGHGARARSSGFTGTSEQYSSLYSLPCETDLDCATPCLAAGGTAEMCAGNYCRISDPNYCLPATIWTGLDRVSSEGTDAQIDGAQLVTWNDPYKDYLLVDQFGLDVPDGARIVGIEVTVRRAGGGPNDAADGGIHLIKGGVMGTADRSLSDPWTGPELVNTLYGGPTDLWEQSFTAADVNADDFGVAVNAIFPETAGNGRAYVDIVYVTVHYRECP